MSAVTSPKACEARRRWPLSEKRRIVELTLREGASIRAIAREHSVHPTSLCHWRARYRAGKLEAQPAQRTRAAASSAMLLPVTLVPATGSAQPPFDSHARAVIEFTLSSGHMLRIEMGMLDAGFVCALVAQLQR